MNKIDFLCSIIDFWIVFVEYALKWFWELAGKMYAANLAIKILSN